MSVTRSMMNVIPRILVVITTIGISASTSAANGPTPEDWIPGTDVVETVGSASTSRQPGPYNSRDVYKVFVTTVAGKDLRLIVTGSAGVKVDYFDQRRDNGLYAIFGAVDEGVITLNFQTSPTGANTWTSAGTKTLPVGPRRTLIYDTADVPINVWYVSDNWNGYGNASTISEANLALTLDRDFADLKSRGFTAINYRWQPIKYLNTLFAKLTQYGLKVELPMHNADAYAMSLPDNLSHYNAPLLKMEAKLIQDGINTDVGGGVLMKNHPALWTYSLKEEAPYAKADALELEAMMVKALDPNHGGSSAHPNHDTGQATLISKLLFNEFIVGESYPLTTATPASDFSKYLPFNFNLGPISVPDYQDWMRSKDPRRYWQNAIQAHKDLTTFGATYREPSANELKAEMLLSAARGSRPITWFIYNKYHPTGNGMTDVNRTVTPMLTAVTNANAKMASWMPTYKHLVYDRNGSAYVPYAEVAATSGNLYTNDMETTGALGAVSTSTDQAHSPTKSGLRPASTGNSVNTINLGNGAGLPLDLVNRFNSLKYRVWVNDLGNANMTYQLGVQLNKDDGTFPQVWLPSVNIGSGWQELTLDLSAYAAHPEYSRITQLMLRAFSNGTYADHYIDDIKLEYTKPAYTPKYELNGGVVGNFAHKTTGDCYLIVVNTDTVNTKTVTVNNVENKSGAMASTAKDPVTGTNYNLTGGVLNLRLPPGDGALLQVDPPPPVSSRSRPW